MYDLSKIKAIQKIAEEHMQHLNSEIDFLGVYLDKQKENVNEKERAEIEKLKSVTTQAINLARKGKADEAQSLLINFENGRKGNK